MPPTVMHVDDSGWLELAKRVLAQGDLLAFPTDTVYGIAANVRDSQAIQRLFEVKGRPHDKSIPVLIGSIEQLSQVAVEIPEPATALMEHFWPGALTIVLSRRDDLPAVLGLGTTVGVRMPDHAVALKLLQHVGPLAVTSANLSGELESRNAQDVVEQLGDRIQLVLDAGTSPGGQASTVIELSRDGIRIIRQGPVAAEELSQVFNTGREED